MPESYMGCVHCETNVAQFNGADHCPNCDAPVELKMYTMPTPIKAPRRTKKSKSPTKKARRKSSGRRSDRGDNRTGTEDPTSLDPNA